MNAVFVLSTGRCGTLALERLLNRSEHVEAFHRYRGRRSTFPNSMTFTLEQNFAYYRVLRDPTFPPAWRRLFLWNLRRSRRRVIEGVNRQGKTFIELNHQFSPFAPLLGEAYRGAGFVHLVRHPAAVVSSFMQKFNPPLMSWPAFMGTRFSLRGQYILRYERVSTLAQSLPRPLCSWVATHRFDNQLHRFVNEGGRWRETLELTPFERTCWYWQAINQHLMDFFASLPAERRLTIRFEDFFDLQETQSKQALVDFVGARDLSVDGMRTLLSQKVNEREAVSDFPAPARWSPELRATLLHYCAPVMARLGYPPQEVRLPAGGSPEAAVSRL